ncbi:MAG: MFS transporter [Anaerolineales bacterium]|nr:MFS transporter [Anaerolineales bacterium]
MTPGENQASSQSIWGQLRALPRNIWVLTVSSLLTDISSEMIVHLLPLFLANVLGVRTVTIGLIEGMAETTASLLKLWSGRFSDKLGQRKSLTVAGYALSTFAKPFLVLAHSWPAVLTIRFLERSGKGLRAAPRDALVADSIPAERRGFAFGVHRTGDTAGAALGLVVAILVIWQLQGQALLLQQATFTTVVWLSVIPAFLAVILLAFGIQEIRPAAGAAQNRPAATPLPANFRRFLLIVLVFTLGNSADAFLVLRAQERGLSLLGVLGMLLAFNVVYALVAGPAGSLSDRIGRRRLLLAGWLLYALIYLGFALARNSSEVIGLMLLYGLYNALTVGAAKSFVADLVPVQQRGTAYGWYNGAIGLAALPASIIAGLLWQGAGSWSGFGAPAPFLFGASMSLIALVLLLWWLPQTE